MDRSQLTQSNNPTSPTVSVRIHRDSSQDNIPDCTKTHTIKTALPIYLPGVKKLLHNINTHKSCAPKTIKLFGFPIFRFWATWWRLFQKRSCALNLIFTFLLPLFSNIAIRMFSLKTRYTHCLIWYIQNVCKISR